MAWSLYAFYLDAPTVPVFVNMLLKEMCHNFWHGIKKHLLRLLFSCFKAVISLFFLFRLILVFFGHRSDSVSNSIQNLIL